MSGVQECERGPVTGMESMIGLAKELKWSELITHAGLVCQWGNPVDPIITSIVEDSRQVSPGACFVAQRGTQVDGHNFVKNAVRAGASAIVSEQPLTLPDAVALLIVDSTRGVAGRLAAVLYGLDKLQQQGRLKLVGVTGTNGKSTFCYLLRSILQQAKCPTAMLGTIQYDLLSRTVEASMTTPPATALMGYLAEAAGGGATHAIMEVSSHALDQGRCDGVRFAVGVFSNLTGDHLDYHKDMASYLQAKKRLFDGLDGDAVAIVNRDDSASEQIVADCPARVMRYGLNAEGAEPNSSPPDVSARICEMTATGIRFDLIVQPVEEGVSGSTVESCEVALPLIGKHNVQNALAAASAALALGIPRDVIVEGLASMPCVPGRLQRVQPGNGQSSNGHDPGFTVLVDYAHTDDALANVLSSLRPLTERQLIVLFGCGGNRDRSKRGRMAKVAAKWADRIVVTSDNPRTEDPQKIIDDILTGFESSQSDQVLVEPDRRRAITQAISMAERGDIVLLAGKGHENYQEIGGQRLPFDDAVVAAEALGGREDDRSWMKKFPWV